MLRRTAFGELVRETPRTRFMAPKADPAGGGEGGGGKPEEGVVELDGEKYTFPVNTPVADMTADQKAEYWRHQSKVQQKKRKEEAAAAAAEKARAEAKKTPKDERKQQERIEEARRDGENTGAEKYLKPAIEGRFQAITGMDEAATAKIFAHLDVSTFVTEDGEIDVAAIKEYAATHGSVGSGGSHGSDPVRDAQNRQRPAGGPGSGQSMRERREAAAARMTKKKPTNT